MRDLHTKMRKRGIRVGLTYDEVSTGTTPYVESAKVVYEPDHIAFPELLQIYFASHDPTTPNRQGNDVGLQYRSAIFYTTERQKQMSETYISNIQMFSPGDDCYVGRATGTVLQSRGLSPKIF